MLGVMRRGQPEDVRPLAASEDAALRRAFGRFASDDARPEGARVVREHQAERGGQWFACNCRGQARLPPVLVPVAEAYVRRHVEPPWPEHAVWCDFYRDADEQRLVSASFQRPALDAHLRLVRGFANEEPLERTISLGGRERGRSGLATLLLTLLERAGLTRAEPDGFRTVAEQFAAIRRAAEVVQLDADLALPRVLCTYPPALPEFMERVGRIPPGRFPHSLRPHGVLVGVALEAARGRIVPAQGEPFEVAGEISIFGEEDGHASSRRGGVRPTSWRAWSAGGTRRSGWPCCGPACTRARRRPGCCRWTATTSAARCGSSSRSAAGWPGRAACNS